MPPPDQDQCRLCKSLWLLQRQGLLSNFTSHGAGFTVCSSLTSQEIHISIRPHLKAFRGMLLSGVNEPGTPVHAASFIRRGKVVLESQLLVRSRKLQLILVHELFHFVWFRLGNKRRADYTALITTELASKARGEVGESADRAKAGNLKNYVCESFCDTGAWLYAGVRNSAEFTLSRRWQDKRRRWFDSCVKAVPDIAPKRS